MTTNELDIIKKKVWFERGMAIAKVAMFIGIGVIMIVSLLQPFANRTLINNTQQTNQNIERILSQLTDAAKTSREQSDRNFAQLTTYVRCLISAYYPNNTLNDPAKLDGCGLIAQQKTDQTFGVQSVPNTVSNHPSKPAPTPSPNNGVCIFNICVKSQ